MYIEARYGPRSEQVIQNKVSHMELLRLACSQAEGVCFGMENLESVAGARDQGKNQGSLLSHLECPLKY